MSRTRLAAVALPVLMMVAVTAQAGGGVPLVNYGPTELGQVKLVCFRVPGPLTINTLSVSMPFFVRGIRVGQTADGAAVCNNTPGLTTPTTLPRTLNPNQQLVFDVDLVPTQLGDFDRELRINGTRAADLTTEILTAPPCFPSTLASCLQDDRFKVRTHWRTTTGRRDSGPVVPVSSDDSGLFYFFSPDNWEVLLKVLNACNSTQPRFWVFAAATTNVEYTLTVTDTQEQVARSYFKPQGPPAPAITDTNAFATCP